MNIVVIYGTEHKGSTYNIVQLFLKRLLGEQDELTEFYLPKDMPHFCKGCALCFGKGEVFCPHQDQITPIKTTMEKAHIIIMASPVYVWHVSGQMKVFLDHFGFQFMVHRPNKTMFSKTAIVITTAASDWEGVSNQKKKKIENEVNQLSGKILSKYNNIRPSFKVKSLFYIMRWVQKKFPFNHADTKYWQEQGWLGKTRPW